MSYQHITKITYQKIIIDIIKKYFEVIKLNIVLSKLNLKVSVYNVPPPVRNDNSLKGVGTDEERNNIIYILIKF